MNSSNKHIFYLLFLLFCNLNVFYSQEINMTIDESYSPAQFKGGQKELMAYLSKSVNYPKDAITKQIEGKVFIQFGIDTMGKAFNIKLLKGVYPSIDTEALRVIRAMPNWNPGYGRDNKKVVDQFNLPIMFSLGENSSPFNKIGYREKFELTRNDSNISKSSFTDICAYLFCNKSLTEMPRGAQQDNNYQKIKYSIDHDNSEAVRILLILHNKNEVVFGKDVGDHFEFYGISPMEYATIIALKKNAGIISIAMKEVMIDSKEKVKLDYQPITMALLKKLQLK